MTYSKKELIEKLENGEDLTDEEYRILILNGKMMSRDHLFMIKSPEAHELLIKYAVYGEAAARLGRDGADLANSCAYMMTTYSTNIYHYESLLKYVNPCFKHLCRYNTLNFVRHVRETDKFDSYIGDLHEELSDIFHSGITKEGMDEVEDTINKMEESKEKIKIIKKKYIGFSL